MHAKQSGRYMKLTIGRRLDLRSSGLRYGLDVEGTIADLLKCGYDSR